MSHRRMRSNSTLTPLYLRFDRAFVGKPEFGLIPHGLRHGGILPLLRLNNLLVILPQIS